MLRAVDVYTFRDGQILSWVERWNTDWLDFHRAGCFAVDHCPALRETVDNYVDAWTARDADAVTALYSDSSRFVDEMYGFRAEGADSIGDLADVRFGSSRNLTFEVLELYALTDGPNPPTGSRPDGGRLVSVAIHFRADVESDGETRVQEGVTTLVLGTRLESGVDADPDGLIHDEIVYHAAASLDGR
jgi:hypothetical protein